MAKIRRKDFIEERFHMATSDNTYSYRELLRAVLCRKCNVQASETENRTGNGITVAIVIFERRIGIIVLVNILYLAKNI